MLNYSDLNVCAFTKASGLEKELVFSNLRSTSSKYIIPAAIAGKYKDAFTGAGKTLKGLDTLTLTGFQYLVLTGINIPDSYLISVSPLNSSIPIGTTLAVNAKVKLPFTKKYVKWSSSNMGVATVNDTGLVSAVALGTTTITAALSSGVNATSQVTVIPQHNYTVHFSNRLIGEQTLISTGIIRILQDRFLT